MRCERPFHAGYEPLIVKGRGERLVQHLNANNSLIATEHQRSLLRIAEAFCTVERDSEAWRLDRVCTSTGRSDDFRRRIAMAAQPEEADVQASSSDWQPDQMKFGVQVPGEPRCLLRSVLGRMQAKEEGVSRPLRSRSTAEGRAMQFRPQDTLARWHIAGSDQSGRHPTTLVCYDENI